MREERYLIHESLLSRSKWIERSLPRQTSWAIVKCLTIPQSCHVPEVYKIWVSSLYTSDPDMVYIPSLCDECIIVSGLSRLTEELEDQTFHNVILDHVLEQLQGQRWDTLMVLVKAAIVLPKNASFRRLIMDYFACCSTPEDVDEFADTCGLEDVKELSIAMAKYRAGGAKRFEKLPLESYKMDSYGS